LAHRQARPRLAWRWLRHTAWALKKKGRTCVLCLRAVFLFIVFLQLQRPINPKPKNQQPAANPKTTTRFLINFRMRFVAFTSYFI
jgi:hypothetical protein